MKPQQAMRPSLLDNLLIFNEDSPEVCECQERWCLRTTVIRWSVTPDAPNLHPGGELVRAWDHLGHELLTPTPRSGGRVPPITPDEVSCSVNLSGNPEPGDGPVRTPHILRRGAPPRDLLGGPSGPRKSVIVGSCRETFSQTGRSQIDGNHGSVSFCSDRIRASSVLPCSGILRRSLPRMECWARTPAEG